MYCTEPQKRRHQMSSVRELPSAERVRVTSTSDNIEENNAGSLLLCLVLIQASHMVEPDKDMSRDRKSDSSASRKSVGQKNDPKSR